MTAPEIAAAVASALQGLRYGSIQLVIHDGELVRIERVERIRVPARPLRQTMPTGMPGGQITIEG